MAALDDPVIPAFSATPAETRSPLILSSDCHLQGLWTEPKAD